MDPIIFDVSKLIQATTGTSEKYSVETDIELRNLKTKSPFKTKIELMRIEEGFNVAIEGFSIDIELKCGKCLEPYTYGVNVDHAERQFYFDKSQEEEDIADVYLVDTKHQEIDISEMLRQEIILHFPANQVCSDRCKGICQICGKDKNKAKCNCKKEEFSPEEQKPLAKLKDLLT